MGIGLSYFMVAAVSTNVEHFIARYIGKSTSSPSYSRRPPIVIKRTTPRSRLSSTAVYPILIR